MKRLIATLTICLSVVIFAFADQASYKASLKKMFKLSGTEETYAAAITQMVDIMKTQYPSIDEDIWDELEIEFLKTGIDELVEMLVPVYQKHLTEDDLQAIIAFYETPAGQKYASKTPLLTTEAMQVGRQWGMKIGQRLAERLSE